MEKVARLSLLHGRALDSIFGRPRRGATEATRIPRLVASKEKGGHTLKVTRSAALVPKSLNKSVTSEAGGEEAACPEEARQGSVRPLDAFLARWRRLGDSSSPSLAATAFRSSK